MSSYIYPSHPCGQNNINWTEEHIRDNWKNSCLPYFSFPFLWNSPSEILASKQEVFWLYFYYSKKAIREKCPDKNDKNQMIEYRVRVIEYDDSSSQVNPFNQKNTLDIPISNMQDVKIWFKCDRFEEVRAFEPEKKHNKCRPLTIKDFEYTGSSYKNNLGLALQRISPFKRITKIITTQSTCYELGD